jgi:hypothetical protein
MGAWLRGGKRVSKGLDFFVLRWDLVFRNISVAIIHIWMITPLDFFLYGSCEILSFYEFTC